MRPGRRKRSHRSFCPKRSVAERFVALETQEASRAARKVATGDRNRSETRRTPDPTAWKPNVDDMLPKSSFELVACRYVTGVGPGGKTKPG